MAKPKKSDTGLQMVTRSVDSLVPYERNPRKNDAAVDRMVASIKEFGFKVPILAKSDGLVVDGHLRLKAAQKLNLADVPVILCDDWTDAQVKAFRLLANRSVTWAEWDDELLKLEIEDLKEFDFDLSLTGFDESELEAFQLPAGTAGLTDEDAAPDAPADPVTQPGDVWVLGRHRVLCGDATVATDVGLLFLDVQPGLMVTDPPYGVNYDPAWRNDEAQAGHGKGAPGGRRTGTVLNDDRVDWYDAWALFPGQVAYVWHASLFSGDVKATLVDAGFDARSLIIWAKSRFAISRGHYHWQHEPCWYAVRKGAAASWNGDRSQTTLWRIDTNQNEEARNNHGTQKPVECMRRPIVNHTNPGQAVYDPFLGSGTTVIAAETTGRSCYGIDIDPVYVDVAVKRWQDFAGEKATLEGDGRTFEGVDTGRTKDPPIANQSEESSAGTAT